MKYSTAKLGLDAAEYLVDYYKQAERTAKRPTARNLWRLADDKDRCFWSLHRLQAAERKEWRERRWLTS